jgi:hypothetical protein
MYERGKDAIRRMNSFSISRSDVSEFTTAVYRKDYFLGDLVSLEDSSSNRAVLRVVEYTEIVDENGNSSHPTFGVVM